MRELFSQKGSTFQIFTLKCFRSKCFFSPESQLPCQLPHHTQDNQLGVNFESYLLLIVKNTSRCRMDVPSSSKHDLASRSFFDPGHETQLQREVFFTIQNVYFFHVFHPKRVRKRIKKNFDEKYTICQLIWVAQAGYYICIEAIEGIYMHRSYCIVIHSYM